MWKYQWGSILVNKTRSCHQKKISDSVITAGALHPGLEPEELVVKIQRFSGPPPPTTTQNQWNQNLFLEDPGVYISHLLRRWGMCDKRTLGWRLGMQRKTQEEAQSKLAARLVWTTSGSQDLPCLPSRRTFPSAVLLIAFCGASAIVRHDTWSIADFL